MPQPVGVALSANATELQQSIFNAVPSAPGTAGASSGALKPPPSSEVAPASPQGVKRPRDDESDEGDVPMEEDDEGEAMEESDSD